MSGRTGWYCGAAEVRGLVALRDATRGTFCFWDLAGPRLARTRQAIAGALDGKPVPQSKCGVTALRDVFQHLWEMNDPDGFRACECPAHRERAFADYARAVLAEGGAA